MMMKPNAISISKQSVIQKMMQPISRSNTITQLPSINGVVRTVVPEVDISKNIEIKDEDVTKDQSMQLDSVMRKRRYKIKKHKFRKRRKAQKALRRKLKK